MEWNGMEWNGMEFREFARMIPNKSFVFCGASEANISSTIRTGVFFILRNERSERSKIKKYSL